MSTVRAPGRASLGRMGGAGVEARVVERIVREGPLPFDVVVDEALYGVGGFYSSGGGAGRGGADFLTSPEVGPLFGACVAQALDAEWRELGKPSVFVVTEVGGGGGTLCRSVLAASPACGAALRYRLVERSPVLRARAESTLGAHCEQVSGEPLHAQGPIATAPGPSVAVFDDLPSGPVVGIVFANELLDNLPPRLLRRTTDGAWEELRVGLDGGRGLTFVAAPAPPGLLAVAHHHSGGARPGAVVPVQRRARHWVQRARSVLEAGCVICVDYADSTASLARRPVEQWLRTYVAHAPGGHPLERLGEQDVTCEVAVDQLFPEADTSQADWLRAHGLDQLLDEARATWLDRAASPDLPALAARSQINEAAALTDPAGLGAFRVLEWGVGRNSS